MPERFIHLEQQRRLRDPPGNPGMPGVSRQITIDVFAFVFPCYDGPGDSDHDGDVGLANFAAFQEVFADGLTAAFGSIPAGEYHSPGDVAYSASFIFRQIPGILRDRR